MRVILQRVKKASVMVNNTKCSSIKKGLMILLGVEHSDDNSDVVWLTKKICNLRIFDNKKGIMNKSVLDVKGEILIVSQFTLHALTKKGNRPSYIKAAKSPFARKMYEDFIQSMNNHNKIESKFGSFGENMLVKIENDGPVTIFIDSKNKE
tara:strand:- start:1074 stop:1526 length:453 start_codon:yes stop_codon:yes gene_type:complete